MPVPNIPIPEQLKDRPLWRGYVVTYVTFVGRDGVPDFKVIDEKKRRGCLQRGLCGLCGKPLDKVIVFIGGPKCVEQRLFLDPPMHKDCALYAAQVCPYLRDAEAEYSDAPARHLGKDDTVIRDYEDINPQRPDRLAIYYCRSYDMIEGNGTWIAKAGKPTRVDWDVMPQRQTKAAKKDMKYVTISEVLPPEGVAVVQAFAQEVKDGQHASRDYLDVHSALRERLRPFESYLAEHGMTDIDFFTLVILRAMGVSGTDSFLPPTSGRA